ncbi:MAG: methyltransferase domain-containing protein [Acidobacteria bacterium]|nr:methyltransferase domain-containing protein [Acidobacteriota bacterium]NIM60666.1 methyltransferase domain-containing protein [Acidobacteriota bacterium]NIO58626.1 methyltransferase domain-containing protein [Acidobacteriota bacterium]NIQ29682.1 methyltransferase domain-containing protein [Acidobacteriota bacterium]NIQ84399.1 methyltransferase domain-containing protein [Acidobacteriota bacterium]
MAWSWLYRTLESPRVYNAVQRVLGAGGETLDGVYRRGFGESRGTVLDVGCGPVRDAPVPTGRLVGLDVNPQYIVRYASARDDASCTTLGVVASAAAVPFADMSFDECHTVAVLHHLDDELAGRAIAEMVRVLKPGGRLALFDMVRPERFRDGPLASILCALDRGEHVRTAARLERLVREHGPGDWKIESFRYAWPRLQGVLMILRKP